MKSSALKAPRLNALPARRYGVHGMPRASRESWRGGARTQANGCFEAYVPPTRTQIHAALDAATRVAIPAALKLHWRKVSLAERGRWIERMRRRLKPANMRPDRPFSDNVEPWDYASPRAHALAAEANKGLDARSWQVKIRAASHGVIWRGRLFFWVENNGYMARAKLGAYVPGAHSMLHRLVWESHHKRPVPAKHVVGMRDGNPNNLAPENLVCRSMADNALANSIPNRLKSDPLNPELLRKFKLRNERCLETREIERELEGRRRTEILMDLFNRGRNSLAAQLKPKGTL